MKVSQHKDRMVEIALSLKEEWTKESPESNAMPMSVIVFRDDDPVATGAVFGDRDALLDAVYAMTRAFYADAVVFIHEAYVASIEKNPITDLPWGPGEMQQLAEKYDGIKRGWVTDSVSVTGADRENKYFLSTRPFKIEDGVVVWADTNEKFMDHEGDFGDEDGAQGYIVDVLKEIMGDKPPEPVFAEAGIDETQFPEWLIEAERDMAAKASLTLRGMVENINLESAPGSEREEYLADMEPKRMAVAKTILATMPDAR